MCRGLILIFGFLCFAAYSQKKPASVWATARFNKQSVMVGEPLVVTITVYTSTWFTQPPVYQEIQVSGALMVKLENRVGAKTVTIRNKKYPAIEQQYVVYPSIIGDNTLPSLEVVVSCPPEGDYKGIERTVRTKERQFTVLPPPEGVDVSKWLSSYNLTVNETWDRPLDKLKAGDVLERRIRIRAAGTLAALIPPVELAATEFGSVYPKTPILANIQNQGSFSGSRTEVVTYLLEKDGEFEIPEVVIPWYSIREKKEKTANLAAISLNIAPNPDLEFILSRQKALQEELAKELPEEIEEEEPFEFLGLNWWQLILVLLSALAVIVQLKRWVSRWQVQRQKRKESKLASEEHYFEELKQVAKSGDSTLLVRQLFFWYDRFRKSKYGPQIREFSDQSEDQNLSGQLSDTAKELYGEEKWQKPFDKGGELIRNLADARNSIEQREKVSEADNWLDLNPK